MDKNEKLYFHSTTPGKTWSVSYYKPQGRPGRVYAQEGTRGEGTFSFMLHADRCHSVPLDGAFTQKRLDQALARAIAILEADGAIAQSVTA